MLTDSKLKLASCELPLFGDPPAVPGNPEQQKAILHGAGPMMVLAGPGSGKTFVLTQRIFYLIHRHHISPTEILVITFTRAAAGEMQQRFLGLCNGTHPPVTFGTFHAVFYSILKETSVCRGSSILSDSEKEKILRELIQKNKYPVSTNTDMLKEILEEFGYCRNQDNLEKESLQKAVSEKTGKSNIPPEIFYNLYRDFEEAKKILGKVDFDDMALKCEELFRHRPDILKQYQKRYRYLLLDEFQDIAPIQYRLVRMLAEPENNLFIVGDDDQSIYGFRGAKPDIMRNFPMNYPEAKIITLGVNYRSTPQIVEAASHVIFHNKNRFSKEVRAENEAGKSVKIEKCYSQEQQDRTLIEALAWEKADGSLNDCAIICRTSARFMVLAEKLRQAGIPCTFREKTKNIFDHEIVNDLISYLEFAGAKKEERSRAQFFQFMNRPLRYISREAVNEQADFGRMICFYQGRPAMQEMLLRLQEDLNRIKNMPVFLAINYIRKAMGYDNYLLERAKINGNPENIMELADLIQHSARGCRTLRQWKDIIEENRRKLSGKPVPEKGEGVTLLTMHGSKGLEYQKVFMPDCNEGTTPHRKAHSEEEIEEERRMFYVGMTRAKKELTLLYVDGRPETKKDGNTGKIMLPSRFLGEILQ